MSSSYPGPIVVTTVRGRWTRPSGLYSTVLYFLQQSLGSCSPSPVKVWRVPLALRTLLIPVPTFSCLESHYSTAGKLQIYRFVRASCYPILSHSCRWSFPKRCASNCKYTWINIKQQRKLYSTDISLKWRYSTNLALSRFRPSGLKSISYLS